MTTGIIDKKPANLSWPRWSLRDFFTRELFLHALFHWRCADTARYPENHAWQRIESSYCYRQANGRVLPVDMGLSIFAESVGAICLVVGLFTRLAALIIWIEMGVIIVYFQWQFGYFWTVRGYEYALLWWLLCLAIFFRGGGRYAVDRLIGKEF